MEKDISLFVGSLEALVVSSGERVIGCVEDSAESVKQEVLLLSKKLLCDIKQFASDTLGVRTAHTDSSIEKETLIRLDALCEKFIELTLANKEIFTESESVKQEIYDVYVDFLCRVCDNKKNLFIIDSYYSTNHLDSCVIVETDKTVSEVVEICAALDFLFEDAIVAGVRPASNLQPEHILGILTSHFGMVDRKGLIERGLLSRLIPAKHHMFDDPYRFYDGLPFVLDIRGELPDKLPDFVIDLSGVSKALCCNRGTVMERWLPAGADERELLYRQFGFK